MKNSPKFLLAGSGGGKSGSGSGATQTPDTLRSDSYARIIDLISEGPIEGFVDIDGNVLADAYLATQPTITSGVVQDNAIIAYGGRGYPAASTVNSNLSITDPVGSGTGCTASVTVVNGEITSITITNGGSNYSAIQIGFPSVIGRGVFLNNLVLQNQDLTYNYTGLSYTSRLGTQNQTPLLGFSETENAHQVNLQFTNPAGENPQPAIFTVSDPTADSCIIGIQVSNLYSQDSKTGDISGTSVKYQVTCDYTYNGSHTTTGIVLFTDTISGKAAQSYVRQTAVSFSAFRNPDASSHLYVFKAHKLTYDSIAPYSSSATVNFDNSPVLVNTTITFLFLTMVTNTALAYPNSALVGLSVDARNFGSIPTRSYRIRGVQVMVPTNYFPATRLYNRDLNGNAVLDIYGQPEEQVWDGSMYLAWTDNPAWCFYDLLTNVRYGLGMELNSQFYGIADKYQLYSIARYCDESVPDGFGGYEPRFTCNLYLQSREDAYKVLQDMASIFRGMIYWAAGSVAVSQDSPADSYTVFTKANVKTGNFVYTGTSRKARHTVALVTFNDPTNYYIPAIEYVENPSTIMLYGVVQAEFTAFGCASRGQAHRAGKWLLYTEWRESQSISFIAGLEGCFLRTGQIVEIYDNSRSGVQQSGRIKAISSDRMRVTLDRPKTTDGNQFQFVVSNPTASRLEGEVATSSQIEDFFKSQVLRYKVTYFTTDEIGNLAINLDTPIDLAIVPGTVWGLQSDTVAPQLARVINVVEKGDNEYEVTAITHNPNKYAEIEQDVQFEDSQFSVIQATQLNPPAPASAKLTETQTLVQGTIAYKISMSWPAPSGALVSSYQVWVKREFGNYELLTTTIAPQIDYTVELPDYYFFRIFSVGVTGLVSQTPLEVSIYAGPLDTGSPDPSLTTIVNKITGLELRGLANSPEFIGEDVILAWRINSYSNSYNIGGEPNGANSGGQSIDFQDYVIKVYDPDVVASIDNPELGNLQSALILQVSTTVPTFTFDYATNLKLSASRATPNTGFPWRALVISVYHRDQLNNLSRPATLYVENPRPGIPSLVSGSFAAVAGKLFISFPVPGDIDFAGYRVWFSTNPSMVPSNINSGNNVAPKYQGNANPVILDIAASTTYYVAWAEYDVFGTKDILDVNISSVHTLVVDGSYGLTFS